MMSVSSAEPAASGIELATISGSNTLLYGSNFSGAPNRRTGLSGEDKRWYLSWQGRGRKQFDVLLMKRAGIEVGDKQIFQFFPPKLEEALAQMEVAYKGRQPAEIRQTKFTAVSSGSGYTFKVLSQDALR